MKVNLTLDRIKNWGMKGGTAILDQGLFSGSNFVLNILLARWLSLQEYGAFSLAFAIYLFFSGFQNALILEPMSVLGPAKYSDELRAYLAGQFFIHLIVTSLSGAVMVIVGFVFLLFDLVNMHLALYMLGVGLFLPLMLLMWLARRSCYVAGRPGRALVASLIYFSVLISGAFVQQNQSLSVHPLQWYLLLGVASLAGALTVYLNPDIVSFRKVNWLPWLKEQWVFGKWIILAAFLHFVGTQVQLFVVATQLGLDRAGAFRALQNLILPMMQILTAASTLLLPIFSTEFGHQSFRAMNSRAVKIMAGLAMISFVYWIILLAFASRVEKLLYGGRFADLAALFSLFGLVPIITAIESGFSLIVRSLQRPVYYAVSTGAIALAGILFTFLLVSQWAIQGAVLSLILVAATSLCVNAWFYRKWFVPKLSLGSAAL